VLRTRTGAEIADVDAPEVEERRRQVQNRLALFHRSHPFLLQPVGRRHVCRAL